MTCLPIAQVCFLMSPALPLVLQDWGRRLASAAADVANESGSLCGVWQWRSSLQSLLATGVCQDACGRCCGPPRSGRCYDSSCCCWYYASHRLEAVVGAGDLLLLIAHRISGEAHRCHAGCFEWAGSKCLARAGAIWSVAIVSNAKLSLM